MSGVEDDLFARIAHGCENISTCVINFFSPGSGEKFYQKMGQAADKRVDKLNAEAFKKAKERGLTDIQALQEAGATMDELANPTTISGYLKLLREGTNVSIDSLKPEPSLSDLGFLKPLLIGGAVLGGVYVAADHIF